MNRIEELLKEKTNDKPSSILYAQWEFDKKIIPDTLQAVANLFSHYSQHDATHSETIIANFVKLLGEDVIKNLSGTDLWLMLEAAYCHDLGMVVTAERIEEAIESGKIQEHIKYIKATPYHDLHELSQEIKIENNKILFLDDEFKLKKIDAAKFLIADYFRNKHAGLSAEHIKSPLAKISMESPRVLIPPRLYDMLARICAAHTQDFSKVMELPVNEDGIDTEEAHPRFIACLLRLGDLLDIDNGRFAETLLRLHSCLPDSTQEHKAKHMSIKHKSVNTKEVEIIAECEDKKVVHITQEWFEWIRNEFTEQTLVWKDIIPSCVNASLPSVKQLRVDLKGYEYFDKKNKPVFTVDTPKALELLQGANFYDSPFTSIRELLQNAVDATLVRIWEEYKYKQHEIDTIPKLVEVAKREYPIEVFLKEDMENKCVRVTIADCGTGISRNDLKFLSRTGSSSTNTDRRKIIDGIPDWMQPAGIFGIGFQSVFLFTDLVTISTKPVLVDEVKYTVEMHNPQSKFKGDIYIKPVDVKELKENNKELISKLNNGGTIIEFDVKLTEEEVQKLMGFKYEDPFEIKIEISEAEKEKQKLEEELNLIKNNLFIKIKNYARYSFVSISVDASKIEREKTTYISSDNGVEVSFTGIKRSYDRTEFYSKNAYVKKANIDLFDLKGRVIVHNLKSKDILNISRDSIAFGKHKMVRKRILEGLTDIFENQIVNSNNNEDVNTHIAACLYSENLNKDLDQKLINFVDNVDINVTNYLKSSNEFNKIEKIKIKDILLQKSIIFYRKKSDYFFTHNSKNIGTKDYFILLLLKRIDGKLFVSINKYEDDSKSTNGGLYYTIEISEKKNYSNCNIDSLLLNIQFFWLERKRVIIPCLEKYKELRISYNSTAPNTVFSTDVYIPYDYILFPLINIERYRNQWVDRRTDSFYDWVMENKSDKSITREQVIEIYDRMVQECKEAGFNIVDEPKKGN